MKNVFEISKIVLEKKIIEFVASVQFYKYLNKTTKLGPKLLKLRVFTFYVWALFVCLSYPIKATKLTEFNEFEPRCKSAQNQF